MKRVKLYYDKLFISQERKGFVVDDRTIAILRNDIPTTFSPSCGFSAPEKIANMYLFMIAFDDKVGREFKVFTYATNNNDAVAQTLSFFAEFYIVNDVKEIKIKSCFKFGGK